MTDTLRAKLIQMRAEAEALQPEAAALAERVAFHLEDRNYEAAHTHAEALAGMVRRLRRLARDAETLAKVGRLAEGEG